MTAYILVPAYRIKEPVEDDGKALRCAQQLREQYPRLDIVVEFSDAPARQECEVSKTAGDAPHPQTEEPPSHSNLVPPADGDDLDIPGFLRREMPGEGARA